MFSSVLRPNLVIFTSDLVVQWSNFKLQNPEYSYTVYSQFLGIFSLYSSRNSIQSKGNFFIHVSSYSWILVGVWDLQLIHDKALVCCCRSFHQKYYLKKRVFIIRIVIIIRHWKKKYWEKPLLDCHCQSVGMSYYNCACKTFFYFFLYRRYCKNGGICGWSTELTWWNYVLHPMEYMEYEKGTVSFKMQCALFDIPENAQY